MGWRMVKSAAVCALVCLGSFSLPGCSVQPKMERQDMGRLGYFEFREPREGMEGIVVGAPHGLSDTGSAEVARTISESLGGGLVIAYGFKRRHLAVSQPLSYSQAQPDSPKDPVARGSAFLEYRELLNQTARGDLEFYIEVHQARKTSAIKPLEVATSGFTFEELQALKGAYVRIRDRLIQGKDVFKVPMVIDPLDKITWRVSGIKNHGTLMVAVRGLSLRIPGNLPTSYAEGLYVDILSLWLRDAVTLVRENPRRLPQMTVTLMDLGRIDMIPSRLQQTGIVIGSPHGSFDEHTAEFATRLSYRTGFAAVVARGFTPTEAKGWRINVNRPTEKAFTAVPRERRSARAERVYQAYKGLVLAAAREPLLLYVDVHQYAPGQKIQVATSGFSIEEARFIKTAYEKIRDRIVQQTPGIEAVGLDIEPLDGVEMRALAAKSHGILAVAKKSLHFELPARNLLNSPQARSAYAIIVSELLRSTVPRLVNP